MQVMSHPGVDYTRTVSNHIIDIIDVLGIEAARAALLKVWQHSIRSVSIDFLVMLVSVLSYGIWPIP